MGAAAIAWTIRVAMLCFLIALIGFALSNANRRLPTFFRVIWTLGFVACLFHILAAFHFHYRWSHSAAILETARQTQEIIGVEVGVGVYFNYLFLLCWAIDVIWVWFASTNTQRTYEWLRLGWLSYLAFIAFNGTAIFKGGWTQIAGIAGSVLLIAALVIRFAQARCETQSETQPPTLPKASS